MSGSEIEKKQYNREISEPFAKSGSATNTAGGEAIFHAQRLYPAGQKFVNASDRTAIGSIDKPRLEQKKAGA